MKKWEKFINDAKKIANKHGYVNKQQLQDLINIYGGTRSQQLQRLLQYKIPVEHGKHHILLEGLEIKIENKQISYIDFCRLGEWRNDLFKHSKIIAKFICDYCKQPSQIKLKNMLQRKYYLGQPICPDCILKAVTNTDEWKKINSQAQLIAQNKPDQIEINRQAQIERHKDPAMKLKHQAASKSVWNRPGHRDKMKAIALKKWDDPEYARKVIENSKGSFKTGTYKGLYYNSGYELAFILQQEDLGNLGNILRANCFIVYKDFSGKTRHYYPDFILNNKILIEVKGYGPWVDLENLRLKHIAAQKWCKTQGLTFRLVERFDLGDPLIRKAIKLHKELE